MLGSFWQKAFVLNVGLKLLHCAGEKKKKKSELATWTIRLILEVSTSKTEMKAREIETGW